MLARAPADPVALTRSQVACQVEPTFVMLAHVPADPVALTRSSGCLSDRGCSRRGVQKEGDNLFSGCWNAGSGAEDRGYAGLVHCLVVLNRQHVRLLKVMQIVSSHLRPMCCGIAACRTSRNTARQAQPRTFLHPCIFNTNTESMSCRPTGGVVWILCAVNPYQSTITD
jgi:hypothetical protein